MVLLSATAYQLLLLSSTWGVVDTAFNAITLIVYIESKRSSACTGVRVV
jgi:hypothetical protein